MPPAPSAAGVAERGRLAGRAADGGRTDGRPSIQILPRFSAVGEGDLQIITGRGYWGIRKEQDFEVSSLPLVLSVKILTVMSAFNLLHLVTKSQPVALRACGLPSGSCRDKKNCKVVFSQQELRKRLTPLQYHVTQEKGTESAFEGEYTHHKDHGIYKCVVCGTPLFKSETKFDSGSGWPSFHSVISSDAIVLTDDFSYGMHRVETSCSQCGAHLGHIFDDGPRPTGKRYCINSASLSFTPAESSSTEGGSGVDVAAPADKAEL